MAADEKIPLLSKFANNVLNEWNFLKPKLVLGLACDCRSSTLCMMRCVNFIVNYGLHLMTNRQFDAVNDKASYMFRK